MSVTKAFMKLQVFLFRVSNGRIGSKMRDQDVLLLHTVGESLREKLCDPSMFQRHGENFLIVASNRARETHPDWHHNLKAQPETIIEVGTELGTETVPVMAREAEGTEYTKLWEFVTGKNDLYIGHQQNVTRQIPIQILKPLM